MDTTLIIQYIFLQMIMCDTIKLVNNHKVNSKLLVSKIKLTIGFSLYHQRSFTTSRYCNIQIVSTGRLNSYMGCYLVTKLNNWS